MARITGSTKRSTTAATRSSRASWRRLETAPSEQLPHFTSRARRSRLDRVNATFTPTAPTATFAPENDQGLPLLALRAGEFHHVDWESLMDDGVLPSMLLGVERRVSEPR